MSLLSMIKKNTKKAPAKKLKTTKTAKVEKKAEATAEVVSLIASRVELQPLITEKSINVQSATKTVVFRVRPNATKARIAQAIEERYKVRPTDVRTLLINPKTRRRGKTEGRTSVWKKAYVTLPEGKSIEFGV